MKRFTTSLLTATMLFTATGITAQEMPSTSRIFQVKTLTGLSAGDLESKFEYNERNQLTKVKSVGTSVAYDYNPVVVGNEEYDMTVTITDPSQSIICYLIIGDNGFISKSYEMEEMMGEKAHYKTYNFEYDTNGHLTKVEDNGFADNSTTTFNYSCGNMISSTTTGEMPSQLTANYAYGPYQKVLSNTAGVMDFEALGFDGFEARYFYYAGLLGNPTSDLPLDITVTRGNDIVKTSYAWITDNQYLPTSRIVFDNGVFIGSNVYDWGNTSGISDMANNRNFMPDGYYDINGVRHTQPSHGINIFRGDNGTIVKTMN